MNTSLWVEGFSIMAIGMGVVFSFLIITIFSMMIMSKIVGYLNTIFPEVAVSSGGAKKTSDDAEIAVAIAVAMARK